LDFQEAIKTFSGKKVIEILPNSACCDKEEIVAYHPFERVIETYCPEHGGKIFSVVLDNKTLQLYHKTVS
jgi:hypothetical protein